MTRERAIAPAGARGGSAWSRALAGLLVLAACPGATATTTEATATETGDGTGTDATSDAPTTGAPTTGDPTTSGSTTGGSTSEGSSTSTGGGECMQVQDCPPEPCRAAVDCVAGQCVFEDIAQGTAIDAQTPGDCAVVVCDGLGGTEAQADAADLPDDGVACTTDTCDGVTPVHTPQQQSCYSGPDGTQDVGACIPGVQTCDVELGDFGPCEGEVVPEAEDCDAGHLDEDCDAAVDESGPSCICGDGIASEGEGCDDGNASDADACTSTCQEQRVLAVGQGAEHGCALLSGGIVKCWGDGSVGQLGTGDKLTRGDAPGEMGAALPAVDLGAGQVVVGLAVGQFHNCALLASGRVKCWGQNIGGALGLGDQLTRGDGPGEMGDALPFVDLGLDVTATAVTAGNLFSCALLVGGSVKCWGWQNLYLNGEGQLGLGDGNSRGDEPGEMGDNLPTVDLGPGVTAIALSTSFLHTCALLTGGGVKCWGRNNEGQLGLGDIETRGDEPGEMGAALPLVDLGGLATALSAAIYHTCARLDDGRVKCWGGNFSGQLGLGDTFPRGDGPGEMGDNLPAVDLGAGTVATSVHTGFGHTCARLEGGGVKCWGRNAQGELGLGDIVMRGDGPDEMGDSLPVVDLGASLDAVSLALSAKNGVSCARLTNGAAKCWGANGVGQLGLGDKQTRGDAPGEMGDDLPTIKLFSDVW